MTASVEKPLRLSEIIVGHPRGVYLIAAVEVWERFSFYGMRALLVLFLIAPVLSGGFGWTEARALKFYGLYIALAYAAPIIGGYLSDQFLGPRRALIVGALMMCVGHFLMTGPVLFPWLIGEFYGEPVSAYLHSQQELVFGALSVSQEAHAVIAELSARALAEDNVFVSENALQAAYLSVGYSFYMAAGLIILGTGFFKPNTYAVLGRLYDDNDPRRENGVYLYQIAVNFGAIFSGLVAGTLGEKLGWHYGFSAAGVGMLIGTLIFCWKQNDYLGDIAHTPPARIYKKKAAEKKALTGVERNRLIAIAIMAIFSGFYWLAAEQSGGSINIYAQNHTNRDVLGFEIPTTWFQSLNPIFIVMFTPLAMIIWTRVGASFNQPKKFAIGFLFTSLGFLLMTAAFFQGAVAPDGKSSALWLVGAYLLVTFGELCINSPGMNFVNSFAPLRMLSLVLAFWFLCIAFGNFGSGLVGAMTQTVPDGVVFAGIAAACFVAAMLLFLLSGKMGAMIHEDEARSR